MSWEPILIIGIVIGIFSYAAVDWFVSKPFNEIACETCRYFRKGKVK